MTTALGKACLLGAAIVLAGARAGAAEEATPDRDLQAAKESFEEAQAAFVREQYAAAAEKFMNAFEHKPYPAFLFNAAVSFEKAKQLDRAKEYFERYLQIDHNASDAAQVKARIEELNKLLTPPAPPPPTTPPSAPGGAPAAGGPPPPTPAPGAAPAEIPPPAATAPPPLALPAFDTKGLVVIDSKPQGATVYLNDKKSGPFGRTPWQGSLESKPVRLILEAKGFKPETRAISPRSDKLVDVYIALSEEHYLGWVEIASNAPGAQVFIDRKEIGAIGRTPFTGHLKPGRHTIFLERIGYAPTETTIDVLPGTATQHTLTMEKTNSGWVNITGRGTYGGRLLVDDKFACATPCRAEVTPGKHQVVVEKKGMEDYHGDLNIERTTETTVDVQFQARPPRTRAISTAVAAAVLLGGGAYVGTLSRQNKDAVAADIKAGQPVDNRDPRFLRGKLEAIGADVLLGMGALFALSAAYGFFLSHNPDSTGVLDQKSLGLAPSVGPAGAGLSAWGRF